jgi:leucyl aminopeptidase (aminopeptidase T)
MPAQRRIQSGKRVFGLAQRPGWQRNGNPLTTGECDAILRIVTADLHSYWRFQADHLTRIASVLNVKTDVPMETLKRSFELPLAP